MGRWTAERWAAASGMGFAVLVLVGGLIAGTPKKYTASAGEITSYLQDKHKALLMGALLYGLAYVLFLWFLGSFTAMFNEAGERRLSNVILAAGAATVTIGALGDALNAALARYASFGDPQTIRGLYVVQSFVFGRLYWTAGALTLATAYAARRSKVLPEWYAWTSYAAAIVTVLGGVSLKTTGFFSPSGAMPFIAFVVLLAWVFVSSVLLVRSVAPAESAAPAVPTPAP